MANQEHVDILAKGVEAWNAWRTEFAPSIPKLGHSELSGAQLHRVDLNGADLQGATLDDADLSGADLSGADLSGADLSRANLHIAELHRTILCRAALNSADLSGANLSGAIVSEADLRGVRISNAVLTKADLYRADLRGAELRSSELTGAYFGFALMGNTTIVDVDLRAPKELESISHDGPSWIGIDTIYRSQGKIPEIFLRGAGVPENFITYMRSLTGAALDFYSVFISYSTKDQDFADRLYADLQAKGVRCWFAPHDIRGGRKLHEQIDEAIKVYDKLLLILSDASMSSNWVKTEIANARAKEEQQKRQMLFPISVVPFDRIKAWKLFDADTEIDSAREIREYFVPDFSNWKDHDVYAKAFDLLVRSLKAQPGDTTAA